MESETNAGTIAMTVVPENPVIGERPALRVVPNPNPGMAFDDLVAMCVPASGRIAIIGYAPTVRSTPWNDNGIRIWGLNDQLNTMPRIDVLFEMHDPDIVKAEGHYEKLKTFEGPIFMQDRYEDIPHSVRYPLVEIAARHTPRGTSLPYLTCSASEMLAFAIWLIEAGAPIGSIDLFGVDMLQNAEFREQRPSCEFWLGILEGMRVRYSVQAESGLLKTPAIYGWQQGQIDAMKAQLNERSRWLQTMIDQAVAKESAAKEERLQYQGAIADHQYHRERLML